MLIYQTLERAARLFPYREALVCGETRFTYRALDERVARLAGAMAARGVSPGERVAVLMLNCHRYMETYLAAERAGAVLVPLNHRLAAPELAAILTDAEARLLLCGAEFAQVAERLLDDVPSLSALIGANDDHERALESAPPMRQPARAWAEHDLVQLYYTSGTTGRPKGVMLSQRNVMTSARNMIQIHGLTGGDVYIHAAPMFHLADAWACWTVTWLGARHVVMPTFDPSRFLELVQRERVSVACVVPTMINLLVNLPSVREYDARSLRLVTFGASPMPPDRLLAAMDTLPCRFSQMYGMTETSPIATQLLPEEMVTDGPPEQVRRLLSCGREIPGVRVRVADPDGRDVSPGEIGEIVMQGETIMLGYWRQPQATADMLRDGWLHSGDLATVDEEGYIFIVDRAKDMIISGGENVYSTEVENALSAHPCVLDVAVIGVPDDRWGERVHAVIVPRPGMEADADAITRFCRERIAAYKLPRSFEFVAELPRTGSGKVQKATLRDRHWQGRQRNVN